MKIATNKEIELVGLDKLKEIDRASKEEAEVILVNASKQMIDHINGLKADESIKEMKEDLKALTDAYNDIIKGCKLIIARAVDRLKALEIQE